MAKFSTLVGLTVRFCTVLVLFSNTIFCAVNLWTNQGPNGGSIEALFIVQERPNELYAVADGFGCYKSKNWGLNWELIPGLPYNLFQLAGTADGEIIYGAGFAGVYKYSAGTDNWEKVSGKWSRSVAINPTDPQNAYVGGLESDPGLLVTRNGGISWQPVGSIPQTQIERICFDPFNPDRIFVGTYDAGVFRSENGGDTWQIIRQNGGTGEFAKVACHPLRQGWVYLSIYSPRGFFLSQDYGETWQKMPQLMYFEDIVFDSKNPDLIFTQNLDGTFRSSDGGQYWMELLDWNGRSIVADLNKGQGVIYSGTQYGVFRSRDAGDSWNRVCNGLTESDVAIALDPGHPDHVYLSDGGANLYRSMDGGRLWTRLPLNTGTSAVTSIVVLPVDPAVILVSSNGIIHRSGDGGDEWRRVFEGNRIYNLAAHESQPHTVYALSGASYSASYNGVFRSDDLGLTWQNIGLAGENLTSIALDQANRQILYVGGETGLFRSDNAGNSWISLNSWLPLPEITSLLADPVTILELCMPEWSGAGVRACSRARTAETTGRKFKTWLSGLSLPTRKEPDQFMPAVPNCFSRKTVASPGHQSPCLTGLSMSKPLRFKASRPKDSMLELTGDFFSRTFDYSDTLGIQVRSTEIGDVDKDYLGSQLLPLRPT